MDTPTPVERVDALRAAKDVAFGSVSSLLVFLTGPDWVESLLEIKRHGIGRWNDS